MEYLKNPISLATIIQISLPFLKIQTVIIVRMIFFKSYAKDVVAVYDLLFIEGSLSILQMWFLSTSSKW